MKVRNINFLFLVLILSIHYSKCASFLTELTSSSSDSPSSPEQTTDSYTSSSDSTQDSPSSSESPSTSESPSSSSSSPDQTPESPSSSEQTSDSSSTQESSTSSFPETSPPNSSPPVCLDPCDSNFDMNPDTCECVCRNDSVKIFCGGADNFIPETCQCRDYPNCRKTCEYPQALNRYSCECFCPVILNCPSGYYFDFNFCLCQKIPTTTMPPSDTTTSPKVIGKVIELIIEEKV